MKISIVTVCFNVAAYLSRTIESVLSQVGAEMEYVIVDGGSTDGTRAVLDRYRMRLDRVISERDDGIADAFNKGIGLASGEVVGILNAGDCLQPGTLAAVTEAFAAFPDADVVHGRCAYTDADGHALYEQGPDLRDGMIWKKMPFHHPTCFVRRTAYDRFGRFDTSYRIAMDYELMLRFYIRGARFVVLDRTLAVMALSGVSDRRWRQGVEESFRAQVAHGRGRLSAQWTATGRLVRTSLTTAFTRIMGRTIRECFPFVR